MESYHIEAQAIAQTVRVSVAKALEKKSDVDYDKLTEDIQKLAERAYNRGVDRIYKIVNDEIGQKVLGQNKQTDLLGTIKAQKINPNEQRTTS